MNYIGLLIPAAIMLMALVVSGLILVKLYKKSTAETALVRTGAGGLRVVTGGGMIVVPGLHELQRINRKTMTITVDGGDGLITKDSRRVDAVAQFFIRVGSKDEAIASAAQSLGQSTNDVAAIRSLLEGKVQDTMRSITAGMDLIELHQSRADFVQKVQQTLSKDLEPNGLELEAVALVKLDETPIHKLDENNSFDITGLRARSAIISQQRMERVSIEESAELNIARTMKENRVLRLDVEREEKVATESQRLELANLTANTTREEAKIAEDTKLAEEQARISRERSISEADINKKKIVELAEQRAAIELAKSSEEQSVAEAAASSARALAVTAEEQISSARLIAIAEREKDIAVLRSESDAEQKATSIRVHARVEMESAQDQAAAIVARAEAEAKAITIEAKAALEKGLAEAQAISARVLAENQISPEVMVHKERLAKIQALPAIISAMVEPARHIDSFRIHQVSGLGGVSQGGSSGAGGNGGGDGVVDSLFNGLRANAVAMPLLQEIGGQLGMNFNGAIGDIATPILLDTDTAPPAAEPVSKQEPAAARAQETDTDATRGHKPEAKAEATDFDIDMSGVPFASAPRANGGRRKA